MRYAQIVMGPAGCGKSTYCSTIVKHCENIQRKVRVVNLDPAAEHFSYEPMADIRELIHVDDAMDEEDLNFGPNGGLVFCLEYFIENIDSWMEKELENADDYILFDCPGQIELYTHLDIMQRFTEYLQKKDFRVCGVYLLDSQFMLEGTKFLAGVMTALSALVKLEIPQLNVLTKMDLLSKHARKQIDKFLVPDVYSFLADINDSSEWEKKYCKLNQAFATLIDDYSLVRFLPLNSQKPESIEELLFTIDNAIQYGEDLDVKTKDFSVEDDEYECPEFFS